MLVGGRLSKLKPFLPKKNVEKTSHQHSDILEECLLPTGVTQQTTSMYSNSFLIKYMLICTCAVHHHYDYSVPHSSASFISIMN